MDPSLPGPSEFDRPSHPGDLTPYLKHLLKGDTLPEVQAREAFEAIMTGTAHHAEMGALLALLATRLPTVDELTGAARVMREKVDRLDTGVAPEDLLDTAGTGGAPKVFNVSTAAAIVAAAAGAKVAKHGNRSRTGRGSAEVLAELGVNVDAGRDVQQRCLEEAGVAFCFAIHHHPAAMHAIPVRKALGFPTIFNLLGPLTNPAGAGRQIMGVYDDAFVRPIAETHARLGTIRALVFHSLDGMDECSVGAPTHVADVRNGEVEEYEIDPRAMGLRSATIEELQVRDLQHAASLVGDILSAKEDSPASDMTLLNSAAALVAADRASSFEEGISMAREAISSGKAADILQKLVAASNS
ncbi:MAG: anthranilate phosphoribosyltransferase [Phycisphaerales bacterium]|nr:anthranilate phosphoribosyltransferase [Phycisphaerales bacterium]